MRAVTIFIPMSFTSCATPKFKAALPSAIFAGTIWARNQKSTSNKEFEVLSSFKQLI